MHIMHTVARTSALTIPRQMRRHFSMPVHRAVKTPNCAEDDVIDTGDGQIEKKAFS